MTISLPDMQRRKSEFSLWVRKLVSVTGLVLTDGQIEQLTEYYELLCEWNEKMNLTAIIEPKEAAVKHVIDTLMVHRYCSFDGDARVVDVGTGAGIPGIVLKIAYPGISVKLLDSLKKRLEFLTVVVTKLGLSGVAMWHARAEDAGRDSQARESFALVTARAVARTSVLLELCAPLCQIGGRIIAYKGPEYQQELEEARRAIDVLGVCVEHIATYSLPEGMGDRSLVVFRKIAGTPETYPRKAGIPARKPL